MPSLMVYLVVAAALSGAAALIVEHACVSLGRPRRFVWLGALVVSLALPACSILAPRASTADTSSAAPSAAAAPAAERPPGATPRPATVPAAEAAPRADFSRLPFLDAWDTAVAPHRARVDDILLVLWMTGSVAVLAVYGVGLAALHRTARRWPRRRLGETDVLVSERLGPAIFGLFRPRIVIPRWLFGAAPEQQALVLRHEREHAAARDPLLLAAALLLVALAPWNPALWWQLSRLRAGIELDCDARVVRGGASPVAYSATLLAIRQRHTAAPLPAVALTEPVSRLEARIRALLAAPSRLRRAAALASTPLAIAALVLAYTLTPPELFAQSAGATTRDPLTGVVTGGERVVILVDTSASMLDHALVNVLRRRNMSPEEQRTAPKWRQVVSTVEQLAARIAPGTQVQVIGFAEQASTLIEGSDGQWVTVRDGSELETAVQALRDRVPSGASSLANAFSALRTLRPQPDNIYLLVDGLPTMGEIRPDRDAVTGSERADLFYRALSMAPRSVPINVFLFPMEGDPGAAPLYWELALRTHGALVGAPLATGNTAPTPLDVADDEYVIFIVDTSGSMQSYAWGRVREHILSTLSSYPALKGLQIMNDEGSYLFRSYRGRWMPDTPAARASIGEALQNWEDFSDSSPREGILAAIDAFADPEKKIALYVYGDDLSRGSMQSILRDIELRIRPNEQGERRIRINTVALPVFWQVYGKLETAASLTVLMRELSARHGGRFVALTPEPEDAATTAGAQEAQ